MPRNRLHHLAGCSLRHLQAFSGPPAQPPSSSRIITPPFLTFSSLKTHFYRFNVDFYTWLNYWFLCSEASICEAVSSNLRQEMQNRPSWRPSHILSQARPGHLSAELLAALMGRAQHGTWLSAESLRNVRYQDHILWSAPLSPWSISVLATFTECLSTPLRRSPRRVFRRIQNVLPRYPFTSSATSRLYSMY